MRFPWPIPGRSRAARFLAPSFGGLGCRKYHRGPVIRRLAVASLVVAALAPALRGDAASPVLAASGVRLAGVPVGGMTAELAREAVAPAFARQVRLVFAGSRWRLEPGRFGGRVSIPNGVAAALRAPAGTDVALAPDVDRAAVQAFVAAFAAKVTRPAQDAQLVGLDGLAPKTGPAVPGRRVLRELTARRIIRAFESARGRRVRVATKIVEPDVTRAHFGPVIVIRRGANELRYYLGTRLVRTFAVATGQAVYPTPLGTWRIVDMQRDPWWRPPDSPWAKGLKPIPPGPGNPLGTRWMGLSAPGVGIHGTPDDASIGYSASHGCIRMHIPDAEWLFQPVHLGTQVVITDA
jgi:lipoprotein-anchoring transpeptidase ErfK/SrfK